MRRRTRIMLTDGEWLMADSVSLIANGISHSLRLALAARAGFGGQNPKGDKVVGGEGNAPTCPLDAVLGSRQLQSEASICREPEKTLSNFGS